MSRQKIGLAILPDKTTVQKIVDVQNQGLQNYKLRPKLGIEENLPHITILQGRFKLDANLTSVIKSLQQFILQNKQSLELEINSLTYFRAGYYFIWLKDDSLLHIVHQEACQYLLEHMFVENEDLKDKFIEELNPLEAENQQRYGYSLVGQAYKPHITFGRTISHQQAVNEVQLLKTFDNIKGHKGHFERLTIYACGENGSHSKTLFEVSLKEQIA